VAALCSFRANDPSLASADVLAMLAPQRRELRGLNIDTAVYEQMIKEEIGRLEDQIREVGAAIQQKGGSGIKEKKGLDTEVSCVVHEQA